MLLIQILWHQDNCVRTNFLGIANPLALLHVVSWLLLDQNARQCTAFKFHSKEFSSKSFYFDVAGVHEKMLKLVWGTNYMEYLTNCKTHKTVFHCQHSIPILMALYKILQARAETHVRVIGEVGVHEDKLAWCCCLLSHLYARVGNETATVKSGVCTQSNLLTLSVFRDVLHFY